MSGVSTSETGQDRKISFKKFIETRASENNFDNDVSNEGFNCLFIALEHIEHVNPVCL